MSTKVTPKAFNGQFHLDSCDVSYIVRIGLLGRIRGNLCGFDGNGIAFGKCDAGLGVRAITHSRRDRRDGRHAHRQHMGLKDVVQQGRLPRTDPAKHRHFKVSGFHPLDQCIQRWTKTDESLGRNDLLEQGEPFHLMRCLFQLAEAIPQILSGPAREVIVHLVKRGAQFGLEHV